jgi:hypothetical protein
VTSPRNALAVMAHRVTPTGGANFFPTQPWGGRAGGEVIRRLDPQARTAWECACGMMSLAHGLADYFERIEASDAYLYDGTRIHDFTGKAPPPFGGVDWIVTNPPFDDIAAFIRQAYRLARRGLAMLLPMRVLEGVERHGLLYGECPVTVIAPFSERMPMHQGVYDPDRSTAAFYGWFIWIKPALRPRRFMARMPAADGGIEWKPGVIDIPPGTRKRLFRTSDLAFAVNGPVRELVARMQAEGRALTSPDLALLTAVAEANGERGVTALRGVFDAGRLATVKAQGLLEHAPALKGDDGERRFRPSADGWLIVREAGRALA